MRDAPKVLTAARTSGRRLLPPVLAVVFTVVLAIHAVRPHPAPTGDPAVGTVSRGAQPMPGSDASDALVVLDATIHVTPSQTVRGDLWAEDGRITHVGPRGKESPPSEARMIQADGAFVVPLLVDSAVHARPEGRRGVYDLTPGNPATFAVTRERVSESRIGQMLIIQPPDLLAVVVSGHLEAWQGEPTRPAGTAVPGDELQGWHGVWVDESRALEQHLLPDGRYTETRNGRADAYTGRYWVHDDRITYLDDTGFWAFGELLDGVLHHAGFVMRKRPMAG
jgi:hypothetical protein